MSCKQLYFSDSKNHHILQTRSPCHPPTVSQGPCDVACVGPTFWLLAWWDFVVTVLAEFAHYSQLSGCYWLNSAPSKSLGIY